MNSTLQQGGPPPAGQDNFTLIKDCAPRCRL